MTLPDIQYYEKVAQLLRFCLALLQLIPKKEDFEYLRKTKGES